MKPFIQFENVSKHFGDFAAVDRVSLEIEEGEFFSILGGSGCGKTTLLRMLAGFEELSTGRILIDGEDVSNMPAHRRPVNMMFQSYALFPHMNVENNIAYGLKQDRIEKAEIKDRVADVLELVQMSEFAQRKPRQLSGGQQQRVALARALVKRPKVLLLDEPLAALDKKLRENTQFELANIQHQTGITFVLVTHDQEEAMMLSSRIAIMNQGQFSQVGTPSEIYEFPKNRFTADFIGSINSFEGTVTEIDKNLMSVSVAALDTMLQAPTKSEINVGDAVCVAVRPEKIWISRQAPDPEGRTILTGMVDDQGYFGNLSLYRVRLPNGDVIQVSAQNRIRSAERILHSKDEVYVHWEHDSTVVLIE
jgi:putrescine transport system ATP-binding protein